MRTECAQRPGVSDSDDRIFLADQALVMLDGASSFAPVPVPASRYAEYLGRELVSELASGDSRSLQEVLASAIGATAAALELDPGQSPSSTVSIARWSEREVEFLVLGDNLIVLPDQQIMDSRIERIAQEWRSEYRSRLKKGSGFDRKHAEVLREMQMRQARLRNRRGGYWIAEAVPEAAYESITVTRRVDETPWALLATDGAYKPMRHLGLLPRSTNARATDGDLDAILAECVEWEAVEDPNGRQVPRSKRHDDKSLALIVF